MNRWIFVATLGVFSQVAGATVVIPMTEYGLHVVTLSGRNGSVSGPFSLGAGPVSGSIPAVGGTIGEALASVAGPIPLDPESISFPGTTGVLSSQSSVQMVFTPTGTTTTMGIDIVNNQSALHMDGGGYIAQGGCSFSVTFAVDSPTAYALTGTLNLDAEDPGAYMQWIGQPIFLLPGDNGPISYNGVLMPGTYTLRGSTSSRAPFGTNGTGSETDSSSIALVLVLQAPMSAPPCDEVDFNRNGIFPEDQDIIDFFDVLAGAPCPYFGNCDVDFNNNNIFPEDQDIIDFLNTLAGAPCP
jgi:hypothetical protein